MVLVVLPGSQRDLWRWLRPWVWVELVDRWQQQQQQQTQQQQQQQRQCKRDPCYFECLRSQGKHNATLETAAPYSSLLNELSLIHI